MAQEGRQQPTAKELFAGLKPEDITVDRSGRVVITNLEILQKLLAAQAGRPRPEEAQPTTNNCDCTIHNTVIACGG